MHLTFLVSIFEKYVCNFLLRFMFSFPTFGHCGSQHNAKFRKPDPFPFLCSGQTCVLWEKNYWSYRASKSQITLFSLNSKGQNLLAYSNRLLCWGTMWRLPVFLPLLCIFCVLYCEESIVTVYSIPLQAYQYQAHKDRNLPAPYPGHCPHFLRISFLSSSSCLFQGLVFL